MPSAEFYPAIKVLLFLFFMLCKMHVATAVFQQNTFKRNDY